MVYRINGVQIILDSTSIDSLPARSGRQAGCLFCLARRFDKPKMGAKVALLGRYDAGRTGTVTACDVPHYGASAFLIHLDGEADEVEQIVRAGSDPFIEVDRLKSVPEWTPHLSLRDCQEIDDVVIHFGLNCTKLSAWKWNQFAIWSLIHLIWWKRLPLSGAEIWSLVSAHGAPKSWANRFIREFEYGRGLLVYAIGRKPIRKKRTDLRKKDG